MEETIKKNNAEMVKKQKENFVISLDLIIEILVKLPPRSLAKFICVSKLWYSTIRGKYFTDLFMTRSLKRILFVPCVGDTNFFHSSTYHEVTTLSLENNKNIMCDGVPLNQSYPRNPPVHGLICCGAFAKVVICNPSTGQVVALPDIKKINQRTTSIFLGYDLVEDVFKVFCVLSSRDVSPVLSEEHLVFTLGKGQTTWRRIKCHIPHFPATNGLCINGIVYYGAWPTNSEGFDIVFFNVRLEEFGLIKAPDRQDPEFRSGISAKLVYYHENIALIKSQQRNGKITLWVLKDVEKQEWFKVRIKVPSWRDLAGSDDFLYMGTISSTGELIFGKINHSDSFAMIYYDLKEDKARRVDIKGVGGSLYYSNVFLDYVENPLFLSR